MKARVQLSMVASTATTQTQIRNALQSDLGTKPLFDGALTTALSAENTRQVLGSLRFESSTDATTFFTQLTTRLAETRVRAGTLISMHNCAHDEPEANWFNCRTDPRASYQERVK